MPLDRAHRQPEREVSPRTFIVTSVHSNHSHGRLVSVDRMRLGSPRSHRSSPRSSCTTSAASTSQPSSGSVSLLEAREERGHVVERWIREKMLERELPPVPVIADSWLNHRLPPQRPRPSSSADASVYCGVLSTQQQHRHSLVTVFAVTQ